MKAYIITTGVVFGLVTAAHILRMILEDPHLATDPSYLLITTMTAALCIWAIRLFWRQQRP